MPPRLFMSCRASSATGLSFTYSCMAASNSRSPKAILAFSISSFFLKGLGGGNFAVFNAPDFLFAIFFFTSFPFTVYRYNTVYLLTVYLNYKTLLRYTYYGNHTTHTLELYTDFSYSTNSVVYQISK